MLHLVYSIKPSQYTNSVISYLLYLFNCMFQSRPTIIWEKHSSTLVEICKVFTSSIWVVETTSDNCY